MHQALYRKWRPASFSEVCGQEHITSILQYEVKNGKVSHAYLFSGTRGTGKTSCAKILAKAVNCLSPNANGDPCGVCEACRSIDNGTATDVLEMDAASNTGVDYIRDIKESVVYTPSVLRNRVYIIDEVHMLSASAFNALLKTLEEPPTQVIFILATTEQHKIPVTILSRCQRFEFRRIRPSAIKERLLFISKEEGIRITDDAAQLIAKLSGGGMRDAISLLELCAGFGTDVDVGTVYSVAGATPRESIEKMISAVGRRDYDTIFSEIAEKYNSAQDLCVYFSELLGYYRDILVIKRTKDAREYTDVSDEEYERMLRIAESYPYEKLAYHSSVIEQAYLQMQRNGASRRLIAELSLIKLCDDRLNSSNEAILSRLSALENASLRNAPPAPLPARGENAPKKSEPEKVVAPAAPKEGGKEELVPLKFWVEALDRMQDFDKASESFLSKAGAYRDKNSGLAVILFRDGFGYRFVKKDETRSRLEEIIKGFDGSITGLDIRLAEKSFEPDPLDEVVGTDGQ